MKQRMISDLSKEQYGTKVYKLSLSSGCTCPNRDGTLGYGGCTFCSEGGSGEFASDFEEISDQIEKAKRLVDPKFPALIAPKDRRYIAYFQSFTNTYGEVGRLRKLYMETAERPEIAAVSIGTRPDCLPDDVLCMLCDVRKIKPVWVELGLQTIHERTAREINRGYSLDAFDRAVTALKALDIDVIVHVILGLPGESREDMLETVRYIAGMHARPDGIKLQQLQILRGTVIGRRYEADPFPVMAMEEYCALIKECLDILPDDMVIHRLTGDGPKNLLLAPLWCADKKKVLNTLRSVL